MSDNIYKDHYELNQAFNQAQQSFQNIYATLHPLVAPEGVQLTMQELIDLVAEKLGRFQGESAEKPVAEAEPQTEEAAAPETRKSRKA